MRRSLSILGGVFALLAAVAALGQTQRSGGGGASSQIMQQYQQLSAERVALQTENARLKKESDDAKLQLAALKKERDALKARSGRSNPEVAQALASAETSERALAKSKQSLDELIARFRETATSLKQVETERGRLQSELATATRRFDGCAVNNAALYDINTDVLNRWEHEGAFGRLARAEPFLRLKRTEVENLADEYRERARQLKQKPAPVPPPAAKGEGPPASP